MLQTQSVVPIINVGVNHHPFMDLSSYDTLRLIKSEVVENSVVDLLSRKVGQWWDTVLKGKRKGALPINLFFFLQLTF